MHSTSHDMGGGDEGGRGTAPLWVKFLWVHPVLRVVVEEVNGKVNNCSLGDSDSIDFNGFLSIAGGPKKEWQNTLLESSLFFKFNLV